MSNVLLINPSYSGSYAGSTKGSISDPTYPTLGITTVAGEALRRGHEVRVLDQSYVPYDWRGIKRAVEEFGPDVVGITAATPMMNQLRDISVLCKDIRSDLLVIGGGSHVSSLPVPSMKETMLDAVVAGEGEMTFGDICDGADLRTIPGLYYRDASGEIVYTGVRPLVQDLDDLAMPAWHLFDAGYYRNKVSRLLVRQRPATIAEFSRGCIYKCDFCASKMTTGFGYRKKSPERCAEEVRRMAELGWKEFLLADDIFTSDRKWAVQVADAVAGADTGMSWTCNNGIRVESANEDLFRTMVRAGCYRVGFGMETGNADVLKAFGKGGKASLEGAREAVQIARRAGMQSSGWFLLGLAADSTASMNDTIEFARTVDLDVSKFGLTLPLPGTEMFNRYAEEGRIRSFNWDDYYVHTSREIADHARLSHDDIQNAMKKAYTRTIIANPLFIRRRLLNGLKDFASGQLFWDAFYLLKYLAKPTLADTTGSYDYYARDRWPVFDFKVEDLQPVTYQKARQRKASGSVQEAAALS